MNTEENNPSNTRSRVLWLTLATVGLFFAHLLLGIRIFGPAVDELDRQIRSIESRAAHLENRLSELPAPGTLDELKAQLESAETQLRELPPVQDRRTESPTPVAALDIARIQEEVAKLATSLGLHTIRHASLVQAPTTEPPTFPHRREITLRGSYPAHHALLRNLAGLPIAIHILELELHACENLPGFVVLRLLYAA